MITRFSSYLLLLVVFLPIGCRQETPPMMIAISDKAEIPETDKTSFVPDSCFKEYWYSGVAELSSYELQQARYGELREGEAVLIYVTEPFNKEKQVKADKTGAENTTVLKLNKVRKFLTGVYPYSIMSSIFYPVSDNSHALKVTTSVQEWCGHVFTQLNVRDSLDFQSRSYFESEGDQDVTLPKSMLEDEIWTQLRFRPDSLPTGTYEVVPSLEYLRLKHKPIRAYKAIMTLSESATIRTYTLSYPELNRTLEIDFQGAFPFRIEGWRETYQDGFRPGSPVVTSAARRKKTLMTPYWQKNSNADVSLRDSLGLSLR